MNKDHKREENSIPRRRKERPDEEPVKEEKKKGGSEQQISSILAYFILSLVLLGALIFIVSRQGSPTPPLKSSFCPCESEETVSIETSERKQEDITMFVMGKLSTGKPTLTYGLLGLDDNEIEKKQGSSSAGISVNNIYTHDVEVKVIMWSLPETDEIQQELEESIIEQIRTTDFVLFTMRMDDVRIRPGDIVALRKLGQTFGSNIWGRTVITLTYANRVSDTDEETGEEIESKSHFENRKKEWVDIIHVILAQESIPRDLMCSIPILPAGFYKEPELHDESWRDVLISGIMSRVTENTLGSLKKAFNLETRVEIPDSFCDNIN